MSNMAIGLLCFGILLVLLMIGVPVSTCMTGMGIAGLLAILPFGAVVTKVAASSFGTINSYDYAVMPLFVFMANIISVTGIGKNLYDFFYNLVGRLKGGLAMATILACAVFAAISSTTVATALTIGLIALPEMQAKGYNKSLSTGAIAAGGTLGVLIPPSAVLISYSIIAQVSMTKCFMAGVVPGIILAVLMCVTIFIWCSLNPKAGPRSDKFDIKALGKSFLNCGEMIILILFVLGGMFIGWFTPTEASGVGAAGALIITLVRRKMNWQKFCEALRGTLKNTGMVFFIIMGAFILNYLVALSGIPAALSALVSGLNVSYKVVTLAILVIYLILGCFMDALAMVLMTMPIFYPVMVGLGADPLWFGIVVTLGMQMGTITPPVGMNVYVTAGLDRSIPMMTVFKGIFPFLACMVLTVIILILFPGLATWLPYLAG